MPIKYFCTLALLAFGLFAVANIGDAFTQSVPAPAAAPVAQPAPVTPAEYTITLTSREWDEVGLGLMELPKRRADPLFEKMQAQIREQVAKAQPKPPEAPAPAKP